MSPVLCMTLDVLDQVRVYAVTQSIWTLPAAAAGGAP
jgi:hypothetical protein